MRKGAGNRSCPNSGTAAACAKAIEGVLGLWKRSWSPGEGARDPPVLHHSITWGFLLGIPGSGLLSHSSCTFGEHLGGCNSLHAPDPAAQPNCSGGRSWPWCQAGRERKPRAVRKSTGMGECRAAMRGRGEHGEARGTLHALHGRIWGTSQGGSPKQRKKKKKKKVGD